METTKNTDNEGGEVRGAKRRRGGRNQRKAAKNKRDKRDDLFMGARGLDKKIPVTAPQMFVGATTAATTKKNKSLEVEGAGREGEAEEHQEHQEQRHQPEREELGPAPRPKAGMTLTAALAVLSSSSAVEATVSHGLGLEAAASLPDRGDSGSAGGEAESSAATYAGKTGQMLDPSTLTSTQIVARAINARRVLDSLNPLADLNERGGHATPVPDGLQNN